jgi:hypothetical protein
VFSPVFTITPAIATALMAIEANRRVIMELPITADHCRSLPSCSPGSGPPPRVQPGSPRKYRVWLAQ